MILEVLGSTVGRRSSRRPSSHGVGTFLRFTRRVPGFGTALPLASWPPVLATLGGFTASYRDTVARARQRLTAFGEKDDRAGGC